VSTHGDQRSTPLAEALTALRAAVAETPLPLALPSADRAGTTRDTLVAQLDDYLIPRLARLDAPLLVVVGGSTGAGKSTLINSLVEAPVSAAGVLRPTTRAPVLVSNPSDAPWFRRQNVLPGLARTTSAAKNPNSIQLVAAPALVPGLALLDAPDIDSVVDANRLLASQLLAAADLWLFVTTAARYADAVPWELLTVARERGAAIALLLDRVPPAAGDEIAAHFGEMLAAHGFGGAPLFVVPETAIDGQGLLPDRVVAPLRGWLAELARDAEARAAVVRQTVAGAVAALGPAVDGLATAADEQVTAAQALTDRVRSAYRSALSTVEHGVRDGTLLRGEVLARWQEFVGTGQLLATLQARIGRLRDRITAAITGRPAPGGELKAALESSLTSLIRGSAADAAEQSAFAWQAHPAGAALLAAARESGVDLARPSADLAEQADRLIRDWQRGVLDLVRTQAANKRTTARVAAYAVNATGLLVMVGVFASTAFIPTGAEVAVGAGTTIAAQKVLEAIFGDQAIRDLAIKARDDLLARVTALLDTEEERFGVRLAAVQPSTEPARRLRSAARAVAKAARGAGLTPPRKPALGPQEVGEADLDPTLDGGESGADLGSDEPETEAVVPSAGTPTRSRSARPRQKAVPATADTTAKARGAKTARAVAKATGRAAKAASPKAADPAPAAPETGAAPAGETTRSTPRKAAGKRKPGTDAEPDRRAS